MSKNILIIDDDFSLRRVIEKALKTQKQISKVFQQFLKHGLILRKINLI